MGSGVLMLLGVVAACLPLDVLCKVGQAAGQAAGGAFEQIAESFYTAPTVVLTWIMTWWTKIPSPDVKAAAGVEWMQSSSMWIAAFIAALSLLWAAGRVVWTRSGQPAQEALGGLLRLVLVTAAGTAALGVLVKASDALAAWFIDSAQANYATGGQTLWDEFSATIPSAGLMFIIGVIATVAALIQAGLVIARGALLLLFAAALPLFAAGSATPLGRSTWQRGVSWTMAFVVYKPVVAAIYALGMVMANTSGQDGGVGPVYGVVILILGIVALPALVRLFTPMAAALGGGGSAGPVLAAGATGAVMIGSTVASGGAAAPAAAAAAGTGASGAARAAAAPVADSAS